MNAENAETQSTTAELFQRANHAHRRKQFDEARELYKEIVERNGGSVLSRRSLKRLKLIEQGRRPPGRIGYLALSSLLWAPSLVALLVAVLPSGLEELAILPLAAVPVLVIWALFQPGGWNRAAAYLTIVLGVLAVGIPQNADYTVRAKATEGLAMAGAAKVAVTEFFVQYGSFPASNFETGLDEPREMSGSYVESVTVSAGGVITVVYKGTPIEGDTIVLRPSEIDGALQWSCTDGTLPRKHRPSNCR